ncbi:MAG: Ig-like domain-containing protein [Anaeromyxobacteraceae bacterium]
MQRSLSKLIGTVLLAASLVGCGGDAAAPALISTTPRTASLVNATVLPDGTTGVAINLKISVDFSTAMDPTTITAATFSLAGPGTTPVPGTVTYAGLTATFQPAAPLAPATTFTATLTGGAAGVKDLAGNTLAADYAWSFTTGVGLDTTAPQIVATGAYGNSGATSGATDLPVNRSAIVVFSEAMDPVTINAATFTLTGPGTTPIAGTVTYIGTTATFAPAALLAPNTLVTVTVHGGVAGAKDLAGNALVADHTWSFTTGATPDVTAPTVTSTVPASAATGVAITQAVTATFSEDMNPLTVTTATILVTRGGATAPVGAVVYNAVSRTATFSPTKSLASSTTYSVRIVGGAAGVKDIAGNALASDVTTSFTTGAQPGLLPVSLGTASSFAVLGGAAGTTNAGIATVINGDVGTTGVTTMVTGFHDSLGRVFTETGLNVGAVNGTVYTAPPPPGTPASLTVAQQALADALVAFNGLAALPGGIDPGAGQLANLTLAPGVYKAAGAAFAITGGNLTLDAQGDANATWVFQMGTALTVGNTVTPSSVILTNGAQAKNVFWQVGSAATINGIGGGTMVGTIIASAGVTFSTAGVATVTTLNGRALGLNASVTMVNTAINVPAP